MKKMMIYAASLAAVCSMSACGQQDVPPTEGSKTGFALSFFKEVNNYVKKGDIIISGNIILNDQCKDIDEISMKYELSSDKNSILEYKVSLFNNSAISII